MKKKLFALISICAIFCGCGNTPTTAATAETQAETTASATTTTITTTEEETTPPETEKAAPSDGDRLNVTSWGMFDTDGMDFREEDATANEALFTLSFDYAYVFPASALYDDSLRNPDNFDFDDFSYKGELPEFAPREFTKISAGDDFGGVKVASAETQLMKNGTDSNEYFFFNSIAELDGEFEFTGVIRYMYDEQYAITAGDMYFTPDEGYAGFPLLCGFDTFTSFNAGSGIISDNSTGFSIGNLLDGENGSITGEAYSRLNGIFGKETADCSKRVKVRLKNIHLEWSDQFGTMRSSAEVVSAEEI